MCVHKPFRDILNHICDLVSKEGNIDFWWSKSVVELLPESVLKKLNITIDDVAKGLDIFDIWFDSGSTWSHVLKENEIADLYLEGYDQFTGWFQSSLLTSVAARDCAPYKYPQIMHCFCRHSTRYCFITDQYLCTDLRSTKKVTKCQNLWVMS